MDNVTSHVSFMSFALRCLASVPGHNDYASELNQEKKGKNNKPTMSTYLSVY